MSHLHRSVAGLRVMGDALIPGEVTAALGAEPNWWRLKGDQTPGLKSPLGTAVTGIWCVSATDREPENLDGQVQEILGRLTSDLKVWSQLAASYKLNLFCGLFMRNDSEGFLLSSQTLISLGQRGIELDIDLYAP